MGKTERCEFFDALKCTERYFEQQDNCSYVKINKRFCKNIVTSVIIPYGLVHSIPVNENIAFAYQAEIISHGYYYYAPKVFVHM